MLSTQQERYNILKRIREARDAPTFLLILKYLELELEDVKDRLIDSHEDSFLRLQGEAFAYKRLIKKFKSDMKSQ